MSSCRSHGFRAYIILSLPLCFNALPIAMVFSPPQVQIAHPRTLLNAGFRLPVFSMYICTYCMYLYPLLSNPCSSELYFQTYFLFLPESAKIQMKPDLCMVYSVSLPCDGVAAPSGAFLFAIIRSISRSSSSLF